jgi:NAD-dependent deacetylase
MIDEKAMQCVRDGFKSGRVVCLTGSGISADSGIATFRGKGGLWEKYDPDIYAHAEGLARHFRAHPGQVTDFIVDFYSTLLKAKPNPAHLALALLEREHMLRAIITQNIDNLHQTAGSRRVIELHGNAFRIRCTGCPRTIILERERVQEMVQWLKKSRASRIKLLKIISRYFPKCSCGSRYRIDIVLFGETLPEAQLNQASGQLADCSLLLLVGTSLEVYPAASLPRLAKQNGAVLVEINPEASALSQLCDYRIRASAGEVLSEIAENL